MFEHETHERDAEPLSARGGVDEDVHHVGKARKIGDETQAAYLHAVAVGARDQRAPPKAALHFALRDAGSPVAPSEPRVAACKIEASECFVDDKAAVTEAHVINARAELSRAE